MGFPFPKGFTYKFKLSNDLCIQYHFLFILPTDFRTYIIQIHSLDSFFSDFRTCIIQIHSLDFFFTQYIECHGRYDQKKVLQIMSPKKHLYWHRRSLSYWNREPLLVFSGQAFLAPQIRTLKVLTTCIW